MKTPTDFRIFRAAVAAIVDKHNHLGDDVAEKIRRAKPSETFAQLGVDDTGVMEIMMKLSDELDADYSGHDFTSDSTFGSTQLGAMDIEYQSMRQKAEQSMRKVENPV